MPALRLSLMGAALSIELLFLAATTISFFKSHHQTGLDDSLCKCENVHSDHGGRPIQPRVVNGTEFTDPHGLSWVASLCLQFSPENTKFFKTILPQGMIANQTELLFQPVCTGSILNRRMVLFASHCFLGELHNPTDLFVAAGSNHDLNNIYCAQPLDGPNGTKRCNFDAENNHRRRVRKIHLHPDYTTIDSLNRTYNDNWTWGIFFEKNIFPDIALVEVEPFDLSEELNILPGCLFDSEAHSFGDSLLAAGYGRTVAMPEESVATKRSSSEKIFQIFHPFGAFKLQTAQFKQADCKHLSDIGDFGPSLGHLWNSSNKNALICVTSESSAICHGDSGGPLHYSENGAKQFIVGVSSSSFKNSTTSIKGGLCVPSDIQVYVSVPHHLEWIRSVVGDELCLTNGFRWKPREAIYFLVAALSILAATLTGFLIAT